MSNAEVVMYCREYLYEHPPNSNHLEGTTKNLLIQLIEHAVEDLGSTDNVSVVLVLFSSKKFPGELTVTRNKGKSQTERPSSTSQFSGGTYNPLGVVMYEEEESGSGGSGGGGGGGGGGQDGGQDGQDGQDGQEQANVRFFYY